MIDLAATFASLTRHHIATPAAPLPEPIPGLAWIWAANGIWKRGVTDQLDILIPVERFKCSTPGLTQLLPHVRWAAWSGRLAGQLLGPLLSNARQAMAGDTVLRPIEKQFFFVERDGLRVVAPHTQDGSPASLRYAMPARGTPLLDLHSHHSMRAYFSETDNRDDDGLSVSAVIGNIYTRPEIVTRLNVYGHRWPVPALVIFDELGPFIDRYAGGSRANADD
jgi:PRTRC genetic system protein A